MHQHAGGPTPPAAVDKSSVVEQLPMHSRTPCTHTGVHLLTSNEIPRLPAGDAVSVAASTGGLASSTSTSQGDASMHTTTVAAQGGKAVASQSFGSGRHDVTKVAVGDATYTVEHNEPAQQVAWEEAPACPFSATGTT